MAKLGDLRKGCPGKPSCVARTCQASSVGGRRARIYRGEVETIMFALADIEVDLRAIRGYLEGDDDEEEEELPDA